MENWMNVNVWNLGILNFRVPTCPPNISPKNIQKFLDEFPQNFWGHPHIKTTGSSPFFKRKIRLRIFSPSKAPRYVSALRALRSTAFGRVYCETKKNSCSSGPLRYASGVIIAWLNPSCRVDGIDGISMWEIREGGKSRNLRFVGKPWKTYRNFNKGGISGICFFRIWCWIYCVTYHEIWTLKGEYVKKTFVNYERWRVEDCVGISMPHNGVIHATAFAAV